MALSANAEAFAGGICGENALSSGSLSNSVYISGTVSAQGKKMRSNLIAPVTSGGGNINNTIADNPFRSKSKFAYEEILGWDFERVWDIGSFKNDGYPYLKSLQVEGNSGGVDGLKIYVYVTDRIVPGEPYYVPFTLVNESDMPFYMVSVAANLNGRTPTAEEQSMASHHIINNASELDDFTLLYAGSSITVRELLPNEMLTGLFPTAFETNVPEEVASYLVRVFTQRSDDGKVQIPVLLQMSNVKDLAVKATAEFGEHYVVARSLWQLSSMWDVVDENYRKDVEDLAVRVSIIAKSIASRTRINWVYQNYSLI